MRPIFTILICLGPTIAFAQETDTPARVPAQDVARAIEALEPAVDVSNTARPPAAPQARAASTPRATVGVMDTLDLGTTSITGNQELPKVLYIVPWKRSDLGDLVGRPVNTLLDEVLAPIDPDVFERHLDYYEILYGETLSGELTGDTESGESEQE